MRPWPQEGQVLSGMRPLSLGPRQRDRGRGGRREEAQTRPAPGGGGAASPAMAAQETSGGDATTARHDAFP
jgi:hypothetical protein